MAAFSCSSSHSKLDLDSVQALVTSINQHVEEFHSNPGTRLLANSKCKSKLIKSQTREYFEFNDHSVVSNLYWGVECIESAIKTDCLEEKTDKLKSCEQMLQVPALLDEHGVTTGISNQFLVCCSYFYLSVVRKLQKDELQVALHFLQSLLVSPKTVVDIFAPNLCQSLFPFFFVSERQETRRESDDDEGEVMKKMARQWKDRLVYHQVMLYGETHFLADESQHSRLDPRFYCNADKKDSTIKCLHDMLDDSQSDTQESLDSYDNYTSIEDDSEDCLNYTEVPMRIERTNADDLPSELDIIELLLPRRDEHLMRESVIEVGKTISSSKNYGSVSDYGLTATSYQGSEKWRRNDPRTRNMCLVPEKDPNSELVVTMKRAISKLCYTGPSKCDEGYSLELTAMYETLNSKFGANYSLLKNVIIDVLLTGVSTSKEVGIVRASVSILTTLVSEKKSSIEDIKKKGLRLCDLANALKQEVHEAATLIYLINPSPVEIKPFELLPTLVEIVCSSKSRKSCPNQTLLLPSPPKASLMIIEVLVTSYDNATNDLHLATISTPQVLSCLVDLAKEIDRDECIAFATILVKCMRFDGQCRKYLSQHTPVAPFIHLLRSKNKRAKSIALEFFHEIFHIPRSFAIGLLQKIKMEGNLNNIMHLLRACLQELQTEYQLLAAEFLLHLDMLEESSDKSVYREEAVKVILESIISGQCPSLQQLSTFILSNMGGTYSWTGEPYTVAWLVKKAGLSTFHHRNMIRTFDWHDQSLQDSAVEKWSTKIARTLIKIGNPVFRALDIGLKSKIKRVSLDCFTIVSWVGYEIARSPNRIRSSTCDVLLEGIEQFLHPGSELQERVLACLCIYNYTSGKGMQKVINFSESVRESLRRLSSTTWMAEELLRVANYYQPNKSRISCVHTQVLEASHGNNGAVTALIYYKGFLFSGYSDGSIKVWEIKGQSAILVLDMKEHTKAVTCFSLFEPGHALLSGSADKTIRLWHMVQTKVECTEVIPVREPVQSLDTYGHQVFVITQSHSLKVFDETRKIRDVCKTKKVKCIRVVQGKIYVGCIDSSLQELTIKTNAEREIKEPTTSWRLQNRPINSIVVFKDWMYNAGTSVVEGSNMKEWRRNGRPQTLITVGKGANLLAMGVVEDFIYLNCSSSTNVIQIWLRGSQQKIGRLSTGSKVTSLLTANDYVICGTESGLIKGWIPL